MTHTTKQEYIAGEQLKTLKPDQQQAIYQLIGKLYQENLEGDSARLDRVAVTFKHNPDTNLISYHLACPLGRAVELLGQISEVCARLTETYLADEEAIATQEWDKNKDEELKPLNLSDTNPPDDNEPNDYGSPRG